MYLSKDASHERVINCWNEWMEKGGQAKSKPRSWFVHNLYDQDGSRKMCQTMPSFFT